MRDTYTLVEVEELSGAERFSIQLWAREGLLRPVPDSLGAGRGVPRRFTIDEVELAALFGRLSRYCSLPALRKFEKRFRVRATGSKFERTNTRALIDTARNGDSNVYLAFTADDGPIDIFRWEQTGSGPPLRIISAGDAIIVNLAHAWSRIRARI